MSEPAQITIGLQEVASRLGISVSKAYDWVAAGIIPCQRAGRRIIIHRAEFERWIREGRPPKPEPQPQSPTPPGVIVRELEDGVEVTITLRIAKPQNSQVLSYRKI